MPGIPFRLIVHALAIQSPAGFSQGHKADPIPNHMPSLKAAHFYGMLAQMALISVPDLLLSSYETLGKYIPLSIPQFPVCKTETAPTLRRAVRTGTSDSLIRVSSTSEAFSGEQL